MDWRKEWKPLAYLAVGFLICFYLPIGKGRFDTAVVESLYLVRWYAREHVLLCLAPAFLIAGAIAVFVSQASVMKYLGAGANKVLAYGVASVSGTILAVCSCTVLPLFAGIYKMGAGLGPATAFLYSGPAINVLAIILTARVLGPELGVARAVGAILFSVVIGLAMHFLFRKEEAEKAATAARMPEPPVGRPLWQNGLHFAAMVAILVFVNWGESDQSTGLWAQVHAWKWGIAAVAALLFAVMLVLWFGVRWWRMLLAALPVLALSLLFPHAPEAPFVAGILALCVLAATQDGEMKAWFTASWDFAKQILPLLFFGVLVAGLLLGRPGHEGLIPSAWVSAAVGGNSLGSNLVAALAGAFMYFATLTEVPILQGLIGNGMGKGPALALLLAGPALSLPNMLVIHSVMGTRKTLAFVSLVVVLATFSGVLFGLVSG